MECHVPFCISSLTSVKFLADSHVRVGRKGTYLLTSRCSNRCCLNLFNALGYLPAKLLLSDVLKGLIDYQYYRTLIRRTQRFSTAPRYL